MPIEQSLSLATKLTGYVERQVAPLLAVSASHLVNRMGEDNPRQEALLQICVDLLVTSADSLGVQEDEFAEWFSREGLDRQNHVLPTLRRVLCQLAGGSWIFDREALPRYSVN